MTVRSRTLPPTLMPLLGLALVPLMLFAPGLAGGKVLYLGDFTGSDLVDLNLPIRADNGEAWLHSPSRLLWNPDLGGGMPMFAEGQGGPLYPPNVLFSLLPPLTALHLSLLLHAWLAMAGMFLLARRTGLGLAGASLAAVCAALNGWVLTSLKHVNLVHAATWLPWLLLAIEAWLQTRRRRWLALLALAVTMSWTAGHPHQAWIVTVIAAGYGVIRLLQQQPESGEARWRCWWRGAWPAAVAVVGASLLAAPQLLATAELASVSVRGSGTVLDGHPFMWGALASLIDPFWQGNPAAGGYTGEGVFWENCAYVGLLPLAFAVVGVAGTWAMPVTERRTAWVVAGGLVLCLLVVLGERTPVFRLVAPVTQAGETFRFPTRFLAGVVLALAWFAGAGLDRVLAWLRAMGDRREQPLAKWIVPALAVVVVAGSAGDLGLRLARPWLGWLDRESLAVPPATAQLLQAEREAGRFARGATWMAEVGWWNVHARVANGWNVDPAPYAAAPELLRANSHLPWDLPMLGFVSRDEGTLTPVWNAAVARTLGELRRPRGDDPLLGRDTDGVSGIELDPSAPGMHPTPALVRWWRRAGVTHVASPMPLDAGATVGMVPGNGALNVWVTALPDPLPRVRLVPAANVAGVPSLAAAISVVRQGVLDDHQAVIEGARPRSQPGTAPADGEAVWAIDPAGNVSAEVTTNDEAWLLVADTWFPGWTARIAPANAPDDTDGRLVPVMRADAAWRAVQVPAGHWRVTMRYRPAWWYAGLYLALLGALMLGVLLWPHRLHRPLPVALPAAPGAVLLEPLAPAPRWMALAPPLLVVLIGMAMWRTVGHYRFPDVLLFSLGFVALGAITLRQTLRPSRLTRPVWHATVLMALGVAVALALADPYLWYTAGNLAAEAHMHLFLRIGMVLAGLALVVAWLSDRLPRPEPGALRVTDVAFACVAVGAGLCLLAARVQALAAVPTPIVDVWAVTEVGIDFLRDGHNPHLMPYPDIYRPGHVAPVSTYWPGWLVWCAIGDVATGDYRLMLIPTAALTAILLVPLGRRLGLGARDAALLALVWLLYPMAILVVTHAWTETLHHLLLVGLLLALSRQRMVLAGAMLGWLVATKSPNGIIAVLAGFAVWFRHGFTPAFRMALWAVGAFLLILLPVALEDPVRVVVDRALIGLTLPEQANSFSLRAVWSHTTGSPMPSALATLIQAAGIGLGVLWLWRSRERMPVERSLPAALVVAFGVTFLFGMQAYSNYYLFVAFCALLATAATATPLARETEPAAA